LQDAQEENYYKVISQSDILTISDEDINDNPIIEVANPVDYADGYVYGSATMSQITQNGTETIIDPEYSYDVIQVNQAFLDDTGIEANIGDFVIYDNWFTNLGEGEQVVLSFDVVANDQNGFDGTDGINESSISQAQTVNITITGTNDSPVIEDVNVVVNESSLDDVVISPYSSEDTVFSGQLEVLDEDINDTHTFARGDAALGLTLTTVNAELLAALNPATANLDYVKSVIVELISIPEIMVALTNTIDAIPAVDVATLINDFQSAPDLSTALAVVNSAVSVFGISLSVDPTNGAVLTISDASALELEGLLNVNVLEDGSYTVTSPLFDHLSVDETVSVSFDYVADDGTNDANGEGSTSNPAVVTLNIVGTNDSPVVSDIIVNNTVETILLDNSNWFTQSGVNITGYENDGSVITPTVYSAYGLGITGQINEGYEQAESIVFDFDNNFISATVDLGMFYGNLSEVALWIAYKDGIEVARGDFIAPVGTTESSFDIDIGTYFNSIRIEPVQVNNGGDTNDFFIKSLQVSNKFHETLDEVNTTFTAALDTVVDVDINDMHTYEVVANSVLINGVSATDSIVNIYQLADGSWEYKVEGDFNYLQEGETAVVSFDYVADDQKGFDGTDGINESSISQAQTITLTITGTNDIPVLTYSEVIDNINETLSGTLLGVLDLEYVDGVADVSGFTITGSDASLVEIVNNAGVFELRLKTTASVNYETNANLDVNITYSDGDNSNTESISVIVNDITAIVSGITDSGLLGTMIGTSDADNPSGEFTKIYDLGMDHAGSIVEVVFSANGYGDGLWDYNPSSSTGYTDWILVDDGINSDIRVDTPRGVDTEHTISAEVGSDGILTLNFDAHITGSNEMVDIKSISIGDQILTFDNTSTGEIDMIELLSQLDDFEDNSGNQVGVPDSLDEIDFVGGEHILSNLSLNDFIAMTDSDNILKITTDDTTDQINLTNDWVEDTSPSATEAGYTTYTNASDASVQLLIDEDINVVDV
jgi:VCBS repeat-containing protein